MQILIIYIYVQVLCLVPECLATAHVTSAMELLVNGQKMLILKCELQVYVINLWSIK